MSRLPYFLMPSVSGCWYWSWMPCSVSSAKIVLLLASTSTGERAELAAEMAADHVGEARPLRAGGRGHLARRAAEGVRRMAHRPLVAPRVGGDAGVADRVDDAVVPRAAEERLDALLPARAREHLRAGHREVDLGERAAAFACSNSTGTLIGCDVLLGRGSRGHTSRAEGRGHAGAAERRLPHERAARLRSPRASTPPRATWPPRSSTSPSSSSLRASRRCLCTSAMLPARIDGSRTDPLPPTPAC